MDKTKQEGLRAYQAINEDGEVYSRILYNEGFPQQVRANMKLGQFFIGDDEEEGRKRVTVNPVAIRFFRGQMFLKGQDMEKIEADKSGEELERSIKNWVEIYWLDPIEEGVFMLSCTLFKTWGFTEIRNRLMRPMPIKVKGKFQLAKPHHLQLTITTEKKSNDIGDFYVPVIEKVEQASDETVAMIEHFVEDHAVFSIENLQNNMRHAEHYALQGAPINWTPPKNLSALQAGDAEDVAHEELPAHEAQPIAAQPVAAQPIAAQPATEPWEKTTTPETEPETVTAEEA